MRHKPEKKTQLGQVVNACSGVDVAKGLVVNMYEKAKRLHEHDTGTSWCCFHEPELIIKEPSGFDPLNQRTSVGLKWGVSGRAFYIKRTFVHKKEFKRHSHKKNVPQRKRGKQLFLRGNNARRYLHV